MNKILRALLKKKGIGPTMSKHLDAAECAQLLDIIQDKSCNKTTLATLCIAFEMLTKIDAEQAIYDQFKQLLNDYWPDIYEVIYAKTYEMMISDCYAMTDAIRQLVKGNSLSKHDMKVVLDRLFDGHSDYFWQKAMFLEALRINRETLEENIASLVCLSDRSERAIANRTVVIDLANPYDGYSRDMPYTLGLPVVLAELGFGCVSHGVYDIGPKHGLTMHQLLAAAKKNPLLSMEDVCAQIEDPSVGWGYVDQSIYFKSLYNLRILRHAMMKRPMLATHEKCLVPIQGDKTFLVTGYTHPPYKQMMSDVLKQHKLASKSLIVRGQEGGCQLGLDRKAPFVVVDSEKQAVETTGFVRPEDYDLAGAVASKRADSISPESINDCLGTLEAAFLGEPNVAKHQLIYLACVIVEKFGLMSGKDARQSLEGCFRSGKLMERWKAGQC